MKRYKCATAGGECRSNEELQASRSLSERGGRTGGLTERRGKKENREDKANRAGGRKSGRDTVVVGGSTLFA